MYFEETYYQTKLAKKRTFQQKLSAERIFQISEADAKKEIDDVFKRDESKVMHKTINCLRGWDIYW